MSKKTIVMIPGAGRSGISMWPLINDPQIHRLDYERGQIPLPRFDQPITFHGYLRQIAKVYASRIYQQIITLRGPIDIYAWSMAAPICLYVTTWVDQEHPGLIEKLVMINPGVFGGPPPEAFHIDPVYVNRLMTKGHISAKTKKAIAEINSSIPGFSRLYRVNEHPLAMLAVGEGVIPMPSRLSHNRIRLYYSTGDKVIPPEVTLATAGRAGITPLPIYGFDHELPIQDTAGAVLSHIRTDNKVPYRPLTK
jgi:pimeloyl-ACP methyl ester carboxylesterase